VKTLSIADLAELGVELFAIMKERNMRPFLIGTLLALTFNCAAAQQPAPACNSEVYGAFDFWLGSWNVTSNDQPAGTNQLTKLENGCLILEQWTSASGGTGQSYNFVDPATQQWHQIWVSAGAVIDIQGGIDNDGAMRLKGTITTRTGDQAPFEGIWTPRDDGSVKQHFKQFNPETDQWDDWFVGIYRKAND